MSAGPLASVFLSCQAIPWIASGSTTPTPSCVAPATHLLPPTTLVMVPPPLGGPNWKVMSAGPVVFEFRKLNCELDGCQTPTVWKPWPGQSPVIGIVRKAGMAPLLAGPKSTVRKSGGLGPVRKMKVELLVLFRSDCGSQTPTELAAPAVSLATTGLKPFRPAPKVITKSGVWARNGWVMLFQRKKVEPTG